VSLLSAVGAGFDAGSLEDPGVDDAGGLEDPPPPPEGDEGFGPTIFGPTIFGPTILRPTVLGPFLLLSPVRPKASVPI